MYPPFKSWKWDDISSNFDDKSLASLRDLDPILKELAEAQRRLFAHRKEALLIVIQGLDASGKNSLAQTLSRGMDPVGLKAWSFGRPNEEEARHDFLWRAWNKLPAKGEVAIFVRSHYEALLAERILDNDVSEMKFWASRAAAIKVFEKHLAHEGTHIVKVWLHISKEEQCKRLIKRIDTPRKQWKFDPSDLETYQDRQHYLDAMHFAIQHTHTSDQPWYIVPGDNKANARRYVAQLVLDTLNNLAPSYPAMDVEKMAQFRAMLTSGISAET